MNQKTTKVMAKIDFHKSVPDYLFLTIGSIIMAINFNVFLVPFNIAPGGASGAAIIVHEFTVWPPGITILLLTIPMLTLGFCFLGRFRFLLRAAYVTAIYGIGIDMMAEFLPPGITDDLLLNALYGGIVGGIGISLICRGGTSPAGTSVISRVLNLKTGIPNSQVYLLIDGGIILIAGLVFEWEMALYAFVTLFTWGLVADYVLEGPSVVRTVLIVTDEPEKVTQALLQRIGIGVTSWIGKGMPSNSEHTTLFCVLNRSTVKNLTAVVKEIDPKSLMVIMQCEL